MTVNQRLVSFCVLLLFLGAFSIALKAQDSSLDTISVQKRIDSLSAMPFSRDVFQQFKLLEKEANEAGFQQKVALINLWFGNFATAIGELDSAVYHFQILEDIGEQINDSSLIVKAYVSLGLVYSDLNQFEKSKEKFRLGVKFFDRRKDIRNLAVSINSLGLVYGKEENYEAAIKHFKRGRELMIEVGHELGVHNTNYNIAYIYLLRKLPELAASYSEEFLAYARREQDSLGIVYGYSLIGKVNKGIGLHTDAVAYFDSALQIIDLQNYKGLKHDILLDKTAIYESQDDYVQALQTHKEFEQAKYDFINDQTQKNISELEIKYNAEKNERKLLANEKAITELTQTAQIRKQRIWLISVTLVASMLLSFLIYYKFKRDAQEKEIKANQLQTKLTSKQADLTNLALDIGRKNKFSNELIGQLEQLQKTKRDEMTKTIKKIQIFAKNHLQISEDMELLQTNVNTINQEFYENLEAKIGKLTTNEKYLAGLIRLNLSNKDIASIRGISTSSAKMGRHRLRKKLELNPEVDIVDFLRRI